MTRKKREKKEKRERIYGECLTRKIVYKVYNIEE
jgi:hypothetical protein